MLVKYRILYLISHHYYSNMRKEIERQQDGLNNKQFIKSVKRFIKYSKKFDEICIRIDKLKSMISEKYNM